MRGAAELVVSCVFLFQVVSLFFVYVFVVFL